MANKELLSNNSALSMSALSPFQFPFMLLFSNQLMIAAYVIYSMKLEMKLWYHKLDSKKYLRLQIRQIFYANPTFAKKTKQQETNTTQHVSFDLWPSFFELKKCEFLFVNEIETALLLHIIRNIGTNADEETFLVLSFLGFLLHVR